MGFVAKVIDGLTGKKSIFIHYYVDNALGTKELYQFEIRQVRRNDWRAYVLQHPPLDGRSGNGTKIHLYVDKRGKYVCVVQQIRSEEKMLAVAKLWAQKFQRYVETGKDFNE